MIFDSYEEPDEALKTIKKLNLCTEQEAKTIRMMRERNLNTVRSTSAGRLYDAVSAMLGVRLCSTFEGEAAMSLQFAAERGEHACGTLPELLREGAPFELCTDTLFQHLLQRRLNGEDPETLAFVFHKGLADCIVAACEKVRADTGVNVVALTGGTFQNLLLLRLCVAALRKRDFRVLLHSLIPPNDGGVCLGQAVYAMQYLNDHKEEER